MIRLLRALVDLLGALHTCLADSLPIATAAVPWTRGSHGTTVPARVPERACIVPVEFVPAGLVLDFELNSAVTGRGVHL